MAAYARATTTHEWEEIRTAVNYPRCSRCRGSSEKRSGGTAADREEPLQPAADHTRS